MYHPKKGNTSTSVRNGKSCITEYLDYTMITALNANYIIFVHKQAPAQHKGQK